MTNPYAPPKARAEMQAGPPVEMVEKPRHYDILVLLMLGFQLAYFATAPIDNDTSIAHELKFTIPALVIYWAFWKGHNWARWLVFFGSALGILVFAIFSEFNWAERIVLIIEAPFNLYLLYWLNSEPVKLYCGAQVQRARAT